ncbi:MAG: extracellular solute-binding protein [Streptomycetales bacterium]
MTYGSGGDGIRQDLIHEWNTGERGHYPTARIVEVSEIADLDRSEMIAAEQAHSSDYDVLNLDVAWIPEFVAGGFVQEIDEGELDSPGGFLDKPMEAGRVDGKLWAVPFNTDVGLLYFRRDLLEFGQDVGENVGENVADSLSDSELAPKTWGQMDGMCRSAESSKPEIRCYSGQFASYEGLTVNTLEFVHAADGRLVQGDDVTVDKHAAAGLRRLEALVDDDKVPEDALAQHEAESLQAFHEGRVLFLRHWPYAYRALSADLSSDHRISGGTPSSFEVGVAPLPHVPAANGGGVLGGQSLAIARYSDQPEAALALIKFLTSKKSQRALGKDGSFAPTRGSAYEGRAAPYPTVKRAVEQASLRPSSAYYTGFSQVLHSRVHKALQEKADIDVETLESALERALTGRG